MTSSSAAILLTANEPPVTTNPTNPTTTRITTTTITTITTARVSHAHARDHQIAERAPLRLEHRRRRTQHALIDPPRPRLLHRQQRVPVPEVARVRLRPVPHGRRKQLRQTERQAIAAFQAHVACCAVHQLRAAAAEERVAHRPRHALLSARVR
eukprot:4357279-Pleurochrysis_carterae.AAC.1